MFKERSFNIVLFGALIMLCTAVLKYFYPELNFLDEGMVSAILLTILVKEEKPTYYFGLIAGILIILRIIYVRDMYSWQYLAIQNVFSAFMVVLTMMAVLYVKKLYHSLEKEQQQVTALFEHATEGMILTNQAGEIVLVNPAALKLFRYDRESLLGQNIDILIPTRFHHKHGDYRNSFYKAPSNRSMGHGRDLFAKTKEGKEFPVEVSLSYYKQKDDLYVIAFIVDITERKEAESRLVHQKEQLEKVTNDIKKLNAELETKVEERTLILKEALQELERSQQELSEALDKEKELNEIKSRFVSMASHEFRTPLSTVLSSAALLSKYTKTEEQDRRDRHIRRIKDSVKHLNDLLEDFLSLGKLEEGKVNTQVENLAVKEFLDDVADEMKAIIKKGQHIEVEYEGVGHFVTDKKLLKNILINLLSNAVKFSEEEAPIWLSARCRDNQLILAVKDEGIGISKDDQQHMFTSFFRGKNAVDVQGTGLGLHIVKRYADLLQGSVHLESELTQGTTITLILPRLAENEEPAS